ncbi:alliin lyase-like [Asparagus officinalis]|uniref:alliin lyase-like n=1 Tax=Asparagus officinalis TaxID=4686 RepID=UPI00098DF24F|nr:alliin lyase-like [Asparagus officinalis]
MSCSGHGRAFLDSVVVNGVPMCECNTCYSGPDCSVLLPDCPIDVYSGDPVFLEPYWRKHAASSAVLLSGWHRMTYEQTGKHHISLELEKCIRLLHDSVGNAVTKDRFIAFGTGATQLMNALVYALSPDAANNLSVPAARVVAAVPYYAVFKTQTEMFDFRANKWEGSASDWKNSSNKYDFIEFVTSPNNPDGLFQQSVLGGASVIYDLCYYWPHYSAILSPADEDVMLFSMSKMSGHASSRFGWALLKDEKIFRKVLYYVNQNVIGTSGDTHLRMLKIIKTILSGMRTKEDMFEFGYETMRERWKRFNELISSSEIFSLQKLAPHNCTYFKKAKDPSPAYGWLKCEMEEDRDCEDVLKRGGIISQGGINFGADRRYTRLSIMKTQDDFELLMKKMEAIISLK